MGNLGSAGGRKPHAGISGCRLQAWALLRGRINRSSFVSRLPPTRACSPAMTAASTSGSAACICLVAVKVIAQIATLARCPAAMRGAVSARRAIEDCRLSFAVCLPRSRPRPSAQTSRRRRHRSSSDAVSDARLASPPLPARRERRTRSYWPRAAFAASILSAVGFVDDQGVGNFDHASLETLELITSASDQQEQQKIHQRAQGHFALPRADSLHDDDVVASRLADQNRVAGLAGDSAEDASW